MSTKASIKYHNEEGTPAGWFHHYNEVFDEDYVYLGLGGVPFEASNCAHLEACGFAYTRPDGTIIVNSVRETRDAVRLAGAEGSPFPVMITRMPDDDGTAESLAYHL